MTDFDMTQLIYPLSWIHVVDCTMNHAAKYNVSYCLFVYIFNTFVKYFVL